MGYDAANIIPILLIHSQTYKSTTSIRDWFAVCHMVHHNTSGSLVCSFIPERFVCSCAIGWWGHHIAINNKWLRGLLGTTAHFEPLHLGSNMMLLRALGEELEGAGGKWYGDTFAFLAYNVMLMVFMAIVMMADVNSAIF